MQLASFLSDSSPSILAFTLPRGYEWIVIGIVALLIFGKRIPGAARGIGQSILEFKRGMKSGSGEPDEADAATPQIATGETRKARFDPQTGKPLAADESTATG